MSARLIKYDCTAVILLNNPAVFECYIIFSGYHPESRFPGDLSVDLDQSSGDEYGTLASGGNPAFGQVFLQTDVIQSTILQRILPGSCGIQVLF